MGRIGLDLALDVNQTVRGGNCGFSIYSDGSTTFRVPFVDSPQLESIVTLNGIDVGNNQVPKFNTLDDLTVGYYDLSAVLQSDTEPVTAHEYATIVEVTRGNSTRRYSHKTGVAVMDLLYYRDNTGSVVYFDGDYTVPLTVTSPVTLGYSITNGNTSGTVILEISEELTENVNNTVVLPAFTDNWGNAVLQANRTFNVVYGEILFTLFDDLEAVIMQNGEGVNTEFDDIDAVILQMGDM